MQPRFYYLVIALFFIAYTSAQTNEVKATLDAFTVLSEVIVIVTPPTGVPEGGISETRITPGSSIVGGERDLQLTAENGATAVFSTAVGDGEWSVSTPGGASGFALMQYDGTDGSLALSLTTMNVNLRENGADRFRTLVTCDIPTVVQLAVYEGSQTCTFDQEIDGDQYAIQEFFWNYSAFSGSCSFEQVNAIEILIEAFDNVDIVFTFFGTYGPVGLNPPPPPPPPPPAVCTCNCPSFICGVVYKGPSDDDDNIDDEGDDDDIVYRPVYYGPVDDDFDLLDGDDDDYEWLSLKGGLTIDHQDDDDDLHDKPTFSIPDTFGDNDDDLDDPRNPNEPYVEDSAISGSSAISVSLLVIGAVFILF